MTIPSCADPARQGVAGHADAAALDTTVRQGAVLRVRPKAMTVAVILVGLPPIMFGHGAGQTGDKPRSSHRVENPGRSLTELRWTTPASTSGPAFAPR